MEKEKDLSKRDLIELKNTIIENRQFFKSKENIGNFNFIPECLFNNTAIINEYNNFYTAVQKTPGGWKFLRDENPPNHLGYTKWRHPILDTILVNVKTINIISNIAAACYIREIKDIALIGWSS